MQLFYIKSCTITAFVLWFIMMTPLKLTAFTDKYATLHKFPLGSITGTGWLEEDINRSVAGMGGKLYNCRSDLKGPLFTKSGGNWEYEFAAKMMLGQVLLGYVSKDSVIRERVTAWMNHVISPTFKEANGYIGGIPLTGNRGADYLGWPTEMQLRAMVAFYEANPTRTDVLNAARDYAMWFVANWNRSVYKANNHGYVGTSIIDGILEVFKHFPNDTSMLGWAKDYQDWFNTSTTFPWTVNDMLRPDYVPVIHAGAIGLTIRTPCLISCYDSSMSIYRQATLYGLEKIMNMCGTPVGAVANPSEMLGLYTDPGLPMEYCNNQCYQEDFWIAAAATGDAKWCDRAEKIVYNAAKGATLKDWSAMAYFSNTNQYGTGGHNQEYTSSMDVMCCNLSSIISLPLFITNMFMSDSSGNIYTTAYGPCQLSTQGTPLLTQTTEYPFGKTITLKFSKVFDKGINIKIPVWCDNGQVTVKVNGETRNIVKNPGSFVKITKGGGWVAGDSINVIFDKMDEVDVRRNAQVSRFAWVERGPLVFACDIPSDAVTTKTHVCGNTSVFVPKFPSPQLEQAYYLDSSDATTKSKAQIVTSDVNGYLWDNPTVKIRLPVKSGLNFKAERIIDLIPYGCTILRKSCFENICPQIPERLYPVYAEVTKENSTPAVAAFIKLTDKATGAVFHDTTDAQGVIKGRVFLITMRVDSSTFYRVVSKQGYADYIDTVTISFTDTLRFGKVNLTTKAADAIAPLLLEAYAPLPNRMIMLFSEEMDKISTETSSNYTLSNGLAVSTVMLRDDGRTAVLDLSGMLAENVLCTLMVSNVLDVNNNTINAGARKAVALGGETLFGEQTPAEQHTEAVELGTQFRASVGGLITKVRMYTHSSVSGVKTITLWDVARNSIVAGPFNWDIIAGSTGWKEYTLPTPCSILPQTDYIVSVFTGWSNSGYMCTSRYFENTITKNHLITYKGSGKYSYNKGTMPDKSYENKNYFRDIVFLPNVYSVGDERIIESKGISLDVYPNPFNPITQFSIKLHEPNTLKLQVYSLDGRLMWNVDKKVLNRGTHVFKWNAKNNATGIYCYKMKAGTKTFNGSIVLIK